MPVTNFDHIHLYSANPDETIEFYCSTLGAERVGQLPASAGHVNHLLILGGQFVAISRFPPGLEPKPVPDAGDGALKSGFGVAPVGLIVDDLDTAIARLVDAGVHVHSEPRGQGPLRYVYFSAPDGVVIELTEYVLPPKLAVAAGFLRAFNRSVHVAKRLIGRRMLAAAASG